MFERCPAPFLDRVGARGDATPSLEIYILSSRSPHNTKVRGGQIDVKRLERVGTDGLELWRPVFKHHFPIGAEELGPLWDAWGVPARTPIRSAYTLDELLADVVAPLHGVLRAVSVTKWRSKLTQFPCQAERALLSVAGEQWETFALEDEDPARILEAQRSLGAAGPRGSNYPAWLKELVGMSDASPLFERVSI